MQTDTAFMFGATLDREGYAYVLLGSDEDSFIIGITSLAMIDGCLRFSNAGLKCQFHADATFKFSDIGYSVVTCGFTDKARAYQVGAFFVVSRRTAHEYTECFRSFAALVRDLRGISLQVDTVMGNAEDAQYLGLEAVAVFAGATKLMCYFHVLYNVRKTIQHLPIKTRMLVLASIVDMHFTVDSDDYEACRQCVLLKWRSTPLLSSFSAYFESQWLTGRYWRWQAYHTPGGYASTNIPCENLNGALKLFMQRRRHHMRRLLVRICDFIESITPVLPTTMDYSPKATNNGVSDFHQREP
ncbi:hypothetical protein PF001_g28754 [Phytophthora fragariae]|uniref:Uncharacterized protein n=1 Tax=Phytophthora fragariae TaxID=53985 RepID=A0A6A4B9W7_9STRA|nr:hypothetical protein PF006_g28415 [Phytophthora fragariae]KAE9270556.1 hypothetical protein PF001_g28754 [Phytophthora fragariae]